jgi:hypothetical protein
MIIQECSFDQKEIVNDTAAGKAFHLPILSDIHDQIDTSSRWS